MKSSSKSSGKTPYLRIWPAGVYLLYCKYTPFIQDLVEIILGGSRKYEKEGRVSNNGGDEENLSIS